MMGPALLVVIQGAAVDEPLPPRAECGRMRRARAGRAIAFVGKNPRALPWVDDLLPKDSSRLEVADDECDHRAGEQRDRPRTTAGTSGLTVPAAARIARSSSSSIFA